MRHIWHFSPSSACRQIRIVLKPKNSKAVLFSLESLELLMRRLCAALVPLALCVLLIATTGCTDRSAKTANTTGDASAEQAQSSKSAPAAPITEQELQQLRYNFHRVHFDYDSAQLKDKTRQVLAANAEILMRHPNVEVQVEGHADHWGSDVYNLALGQRRAESVRRFLTSYGVSNDQLKVISFGEERPLVEEGDRVVEAPNRRAEFLVIVGTDGISSSY
ncbi:MAG: hypothetical protein CL928_03125 [Deltaproteobacteria bacterium]|nr:hypothetical protein [Deltaproteobacteria bacterium]